MNLVGKAWRVLREQGLIAVAKRASVRLFGDNSVKASLVKYEDAIEVDWTVPHPAVTQPFTITSERLTVAWIISPPGLNSGGHQNIFRFIKFLEDAGHEARIYLYSANTRYSSAEVRNLVAASSSYPNLRASIDDYPSGGVPADTDVIFATGWETAYRSFRDASAARRFYFVQDFEPHFYPVGSESVLAENTYRFGFSAITAGDWLARKLHDEYGMWTAAFSFGADPSHYRRINSEERSEVFFYARPATERRGFDLGIMALDLFARSRPDYTINLVGEDLRHLNIPFTHNNLRGLQVTDLNDVYNRCAVGLVLSFTNFSLLPLELLGAGVIPVVNDGDNNRLVSDNPFIEYTPASPHALAQRLIQVVDRADLSSHSESAARSVSALGWEDAGRQFISAFEGKIRG